MVRRVFEGRTSWYERGNAPTVLRTWLIWQVGHDVNGLNREFVEY